MFQNKTPWWIALFVWCGLSTWWHVCKIKELCSDATPIAVPSYSIPGLSIADGDYLKLESLGNFGFKKSSAEANLGVVKPQLDSLAAYLKANPGKKLTLTGLYASTEENKTSFENMGLARANWMKQYLVQAGADANNISTASQMIDLSFSPEDSTHGCVQFGFMGGNATEDKEAEKLAEEQVYNNLFKPMDLYFKTGSSDYIKTDDNQKFLEEAKKYLAANASKKLVMTGHTDNVGSDGLNMTLSGKRASQVKGSFEKYGIAGSQLNTDAKGETEPKADNATADGRRANRRVTIVVQ